MIRGDDDVFALLEEMGGCGGEDASLPPAGTDKVTTINSFAMPRTLEQAFQLNPPSNPDVEIIRHRNHEKFKADFYDLFRSCVPSAGVAAAAAPPSASQKETPNAQTNQCIRSVLQPVWFQMPPHSVWERLQFSLKALEADCVRYNLQSLGQPPPWCSIENEEQLINHLLSPSVYQIYAWTLQGKQIGIVWEPLIPVPNISSREINDETNQRYLRSTFSILEEEVKFQFIRSFKKCIGGSRKETIPSVDEVYSYLKNIPEDTAKEAQSDNVMGVKNEKQAFILQNIFSSQPFKKVLRKLHKKFMYLAEETYSNYLSDLKKCTERKLAEDQQQMNRKRKGSKHKSRNLPKITFVDEDYDATINLKKDADRQARVTFGGISLKINIDHLRKLARLHSLTSSNIFGHDVASSFSRLLFTLLLRYDALEGAGLQSAIPHSVFRFLRSKFGCEFESFASPFNCYEKQEGFGSAFGDTDAWFGSEGSFFGVDFLSKGGCFQANPPFAAEFIKSMYERMHYFLSISEGGESTTNGEIPIQFVIFVPSWVESASWQSLLSSPYLSKHCLIDQKKHYYAEGTQHRRSQRAIESSAKDDGRKGCYRIASFDTSVFFLQNAAAKKKWSLVEVQEGLEKAFELHEEQEEGKIAVKSKKPSLKSAERRIIPSSLTTSRKATQCQPDKKKEKKALAVKKKALISGGEDELNIVKSLGLFDGDGNQRKRCKR